jgi:hypothetical protein
MRQVRGQGSAARRGELFTQERQAAAAAFNNKEPERYRDALAVLYRDFPENSRVLRNLALAEARLGHPEASLKMLRDYAAMGCTLDLKNEAWAPVREQAANVPQLTANAAAASHGQRIFKAPDSNLLLEDVAFDSSGSRFLLSSVRQGKIIACGRDGRCEDFVKLSRDISPGGILAVAVDSRRGVLWATVVGMEAWAEFRPEDDGRSAVLKFDIRTHKLLGRFEPRDGKKHAMGDMTVASNGDVFVSDGLSGDVFTIRNGSDELESMVPSGLFLSPQTPALSADEKFLYVPDYSLGIAIIRLSDRHVEWVKPIVPAALEGIDGLYRFQDRLIAVQNGTQPERIVSFHLKSPAEIDAFQVLEANWTGLGDPTHGVIVGNDFLFIANSGWDRMGAKGEFKAGPAPEVWKLALL